MTEEFATTCYDLECLNFERLTGPERFSLAGK